MNANRFLEHPNSVGESYWQHLRAAFGYSARMLWGALCCAIHGLFPWLHRTTGSDTIYQLHAELQARSNKASKGQSPRRDASVTGPFQRADSHRVPVPPY